MFHQILLSFLTIGFTVSFAVGQDAKSSAETPAESATESPVKPSSGGPANVLDGMDPEKPVAVGNPESTIHEPEPFSPEQKVAIEAFIESRTRWADTLSELKAVGIRYSNDEDRSDAAKSRFQELRNLARTRMNETFDRAVELFQVRIGDYEAGSMMATMLEYRESMSIYENSLEAAEALLKAELTYPFLYKIAARSAFLDGRYDRVMKHYNAFVELNGVEKLDKIDNVIASFLEVYPDYWKKEQELRDAEAKADDLPRVLMETTRGPVTIELFENEAPNTVANFIKLAEDGYYDGADFYQVVDDFIAMGGDPVGDGTSTTGRFLPDEHQNPNSRQFFRGSLSMAKIPDPRDKNKYVPNSASSQFAIALMPYISLDNQQTVFGRIIDGMEAVSTFRRIDPTEKKEKSIQMPPDRIISMKVIRKRPHSYDVKYTQ